MSEVEGHLNSQSDMPGRNGKTPDETPEETPADATSGVHSTQISPELRIVEVSGEGFEGWGDDNPPDPFGQAGEPSSLNPQPTEPAEGPEPPSAAKTGSTADESLGEYLRRRREAAGITIDQLASITKIKGRIISAIEEDRFEDAPPIPIVRGFLKSLAAEIGLSADNLLSRLDRAGLNEKVETVFPEWSAQIKASRRSRRVRVPAVAFLLLVIGAAYLFYIEAWKFSPNEVVLPAREKIVKAEAKKVMKPETKKVVKAETTKTDEAPGTPESGAGKKIEAPSPRPPDGLAATVARTTPQAGPPPARDPATASANGAETRKDVENSKVKLTLEKSAVSSGAPLVLNITAKGDTWLRVIVDGKQRDEIFLLEGESRRWSGDKTFVLTIGNASSTVVELNGSSISLPKTESNLVRDFLISKNNLP